MAAPPIESLHFFSRKKIVVAVMYCKRSHGLIKINGYFVDLVEPEILRYRTYEPILFLGCQCFAGIDMRIRVKGGGQTSQSMPSEVLVVVGEPDGRIVVLGTGEEKVSVLVVVDVHNDDDVDHVVDI